MKGELLKLTFLASFTTLVHEAWKFFEDYILVFLLSVFDDYSKVETSIEKMDFIIRGLYIIILTMVALKIVFKPLYNLMHWLFGKIFGLIGLKRVYSLFVTKNKISRFVDMTEEDYINKKSEEFEQVTNKTIGVVKKINIKSGGKIMSKLLSKIIKDLFGVAKWIVNNKNSLTGTGFIWSFVAYATYLLVNGYLDDLPYVVGNYVFVEALLIVVAIIVQGAINGVGFENLTQIIKRKEVEGELKDITNDVKRLETLMKKAKKPTLLDELNKLLK